MDTAMDVVERYLAIWNETDGARRRQLIERTWSEDGLYYDPVFATSGHDEIDAMVAGFHQQFPGLHFERVGEIEGHHDRLRFRWDLLDADGARQAAGTDVAVVSPDGLLLDVTGFFDVAPVLPDAVTEGATT
ncbi:MAG TPA: nuclear transport factor 2 family protein [Thermomicrobiales bacterium]|nr:nuclear transport factor 2 family protein [Thermomicrobiales bacterium]